jgi:hypothetical protein
MVPIGLMEAPSTDKIVFASNNETVSFDFDPANFVYFRTRAITADVVNQNGDFFEEAEVIKSYKSFIGAGLYKDHDSNSVDKSIGKVLWAEWVPNGKYVECYCAIDKTLAPDLAHRVKVGIATSVSMGCGKAGTKIIMANGEPRNIEDIKIGDMVLNHFGDKDIVISLFSRLYQEQIYKISVAPLEKPIYITGEHPVLAIKKTKENGPAWIKVADLSIGDFVSFPLLDSDPYRFPILDIEKEDYNEKVYNFGVKNANSYLAEGMAVHNCSVQEAICSVCGHKAVNIDQLCKHMKPGFGVKGKHDNSGNIIYEINRGLQFNELSLVTVPADPTARIFEVYASLKKAAAEVNGVTGPTGAAESAGPTEPISQTDLLRMEKFYLETHIPRVIALPSYEKIVDYGRAQLDEMKKSSPLEHEFFIDWLKNVKLKGNFDDWLIVEEEDLSDVTSVEVEATPNSYEINNKGDIVLSKLSVKEVMDLPVRKAREVIPAIQDVKLLKFALRECSPLPGKESLCRILNKRILELGMHPH